MENTLKSAQNTSQLRKVLYGFFKWYLIALDKLYFIIYIISMYVLRSNKRIYSYLSRINHRPAIGITFFIFGL